MPSNLAGLLDTNDEKPSSARRHPIPQNNAAPKRILFLSAHISGIALHGIYHPILHLFHDAHMVRHAVLGGPVEENKHSRRGFCRAVQPEATLLEPLHSEDAAGELGVGSATAAFRPASCCEELVKFLPASVVFSWLRVRTGLFNSSFVIKINFLSALRIEKAPAGEQMLPQL